MLLVGSVQLTDAGKWQSEKEEDGGEAAAAMVVVG
jgi:hypothetical protein